MGWADGQARFRTYPATRTLARAARVRARVSLPTKRILSGESPTATARAHPTDVFARLGRLKLTHRAQLGGRSSTRTNVVPDACVLRNTRKRARSGAGGTWMSYMLSRTGLANELEP